MSLWSRLEKRLGEWLPDDVRDQLVGAKKLADQQRFEDALAVVSALKDQHSDHPGVLSMEAYLFHLRGDASQASALADKALEGDSRSALALIVKGADALRRASGDEAASYYRTILDSADGERDHLAAGYLGLGRAYLLSGEPEKAIRELRKAVAESPSEPLARALLGTTLLRHASALREARRHLERATQTAAPPNGAWIALGELELQEGNIEDAVRCFAQVPADAESEATARASMGLAEAAVAQGDFDNARRQFEDAADGCPEMAATALARAADCEFLAGRPDDAITRYRAALEIAGSEDILERALRAAATALDVDAARTLAEAQLQAKPEDPVALAIVARAKLAVGDEDGARAELEKVRANELPSAVHCALATLSLQQGELDAAVTHALAALARTPGDPGARSVLESARHAQFPPPKSGDPLLVGEALRPILRGLPAASESLGRVEQALANYDQALLVTVMGEFSSGKSSFVNAFVGADIAPVGVTPTTATINVAKYGREKGGRVRYHDGTMRELSWEALQETLADLGEEEAKRIELVEVLLPLPQLEQIHLVDTPGLNSLLPEHEAVAQRFIDRADAVIWLMSAQQAGKATERKALERLKKLKTRALGVLNKIDQISDSDTEQVVSFVETEMARYLELVVPFSARLALSGEDEKSNIARLRGALEKHFFQRSRQIKLEVTLRHLKAAKQRAQEAVEGELEQANTAAKHLAAAQAAVAEHEKSISVLMTTERQRLADDASALYRRAAQEVLDLVRPRQTPFGSHKASPADRDYVLSVLEAGYENLLEPSRARLEVAFGDAFTAIATAAGSLGPFEQEVRRDIASIQGQIATMLQAGVFEQALAYVRGYLRGGRIDAFFRDDLPRLELTEQSVFKSLSRNAPDLDSVIRGPLRFAITDAFSQLKSRLEHHATAQEDRRFDTTVGLARALQSVEDALANVAAGAVHEPDAAQADPRD